MQALNIVNLIESNPITKLTNVYNNRFLSKIQENFTETEQQFFFSSCYCYLNYNQNTDFVIDLDDIWKWLGFSVKSKAKTLLEKNFVVNKDYKILIDDNAKQKTDVEKKHGGHNKETFMLTVKCFKLVCIKADTKKANEIHEYFIKLEEILQQIIHEECNEFKLQLETAKNTIEISNSELETAKNTIISTKTKDIAKSESLKQIIAQRLQPNNDNNIRLEMVPESNDLLNQILKTVQNLEKTVQSLEKSNKEISDKLNALQTKTTTNFNTPLVTVGPRLQQINEETLTINKVYESVAECLKEYNFKVKRPSIDKAIIENTIYYGFRWAYVDRDKDPNIITNIEPTKPTKIQNVGYIAKLNKEKTEIINVYLDRKIACSENNYKSLSALDNHVKNETLTNGHYYVLFHKCTVPLQQDFIQRCGEPILYKDGVGQFNSDNQLHHEFVCKYDAIKQLKISDKTLAKVIDKNVLYNNYYYKHIGSKIKCV